MGEAIHYALTLAAILVVIFAYRWSQSIETFAGDAPASAIIFHGWRYPPTSRAPADAEIDRVASGSIGYSGADVALGTGSRDFSQAPIFSEHMCGGKDAMCKCSGNETK